MKLFFSVILSIGVFLTLPVAITVGAQSPVVNKENTTKYVIDGFRSSKFGQTQKQVLASIKKDFGVDAKDVVINYNQKDKTTILSTNVKSLSPFTNSGTIQYVLGYKTKRLFRVNIYWVSDAKTKKDLLIFSESALSLLEYYSRYDLSDYKVIQGNIVDDGMVLLGLVAKSDKKSLMELVLSNVEVNLNEKKQLDLELIENKTPFAKISYIADATNLDVFEFKNGDF